MLAAGNMWLMMLQYFGSNFTFFFCLSWLFPYVQTTYNLAYTEAGFYTMVPLFGGAAGNLFSGWLVDRLYRAGRKRLSRRVPAIAGFSLAAVGLLLSVGQSEIWGAMFWLTLAIFGADMTLSPSWSFCIDIGGSHAGQGFRHDEHGRPSVRKRTVSAGPGQCTSSMWCSVSELMMNTLSPVRRVEAGMT